MPTCSDCRYFQVSPLADKTYADCLRGGASGGCIAFHPRRPKQKAGPRFEPKAGVRSAAWRLSRALESNRIGLENFGKTYDNGDGTFSEVTKRKARK